MIAMITPVVPTVEDLWEVAGGMVGYIGTVAVLLLAFSILRSI